MKSEIDFKKKIDLIKKKQEKVVILLELYEKSLENEGRLYHLFEDKVINSNFTDTYKCYACESKVKRRLEHFLDYKYFLVNRETKEIVCYGNKQRLKSYMLIRKIINTDVMNDVKDFGVW
jgi:hypothetical protein